jgi:hypothetical protein
MSLMVNLLGRTGRYAILLAFWYLSAYVLMMDWRFPLPAYDTVSGDRVDQSNYRLAPNVNYRPPGGVTMVGPCVCWPNKVFWPVDWVVRRLLAPVPSKGRLYVQRGVAGCEPRPLSHRPPQVQP